MGSDMLIRILYRKEDSPFDRVAADQAIQRVVHSEGDNLRQTLHDCGWMGVDESSFDDDELLREAVRDALRSELAEFLESLDGRDVASWRMGGIRVYATGGGSWGDSPTEAFAAWSFLEGHDVPEHWQTEIGRALGLLMPVPYNGPDSDIIEYAPWP